MDTDFKICARLDWNRKLPGQHKQVGITGHHDIGSSGKRQLQKRPIKRVSTFRNHRGGNRHGDAFAERQIIVKQIPLFADTQCKLRTGENPDQLLQGIATYQWQNVSRLPGTT